MCKKQKKAISFLLVFLVCSILLNVVFLNKQSRIENDYGFISYSRLENIAVLSSSLINYLNQSYLNNEINKESIRNNRNILVLERECAFIDADLKVLQKLTSKVVEFKFYDFYSEVLFYVDHNEIELLIAYLEEHCGQFEKIIVLYDNYKIDDRNVNISKFMESINQIKTEKIS